jgi:predicted nuclease with TOPRIM domain
MDLKDIAFGLQTKFEVTCKEQEDLIKAAIAMLYDQQAQKQVIEYHLEWLRDKFDEERCGDKQTEAMQLLHADLRDITTRCYKAEEENAEFRARSNATVVDAAQLAAENNSLRIEIASLRSECSHLRDEIRGLEQKALDSLYAKNEAELSLFKYIKGEGKKEAAQ